MMVCGVQEFRNKNGIILNRGNYRNKCGYLCGLKARLCAEFRETSADIDFLPPVFGRLRPLLYLFRGQCSKNVHVKSTVYRAINILKSILRYDTIYSSFRQTQSEIKNLQL